MFRLILNNIKPIIRNYIYPETFKADELQLIKKIFYNNESFKLLNKIPLYNNSRKVFNKIEIYRKKFSKNLVNKKKIDLLIEEEIKEENFSKFDSFDLLLMYQILVSLNLLFSALTVRERAVNVSLKYNGYSPYRLNYRIKSHIEKMEWESLKKLINKFTFNRYIDKNLFNNAKKVLSIFNVENTFAIVAKNTIHDDDYYKFLRNKTVAIVGPSPSTKCLGKEIDSYDVVIRPSFFGNHFLESEEIVGKKTNVSYYNYRKSSYFLEKKDQIMKKLDFACLKRPLRNYENTRIRTPQLNSTFLFGDPNMIQIILYDVMLSNPKKVKLYLTNFYTSKQKYGYSYYEMTNNNKFKMDSISMAMHDMISQFKFVQNLYSFKLIDADDMTKTVLKLSDRELISKLVNNYDY